MHNMNIIQYKITKYTNKLSNTTDINKANQYQSMLRKYHRINRLYKSKSYNNNNYNNYNSIIFVENEDKLDNFMP